MKISDIDISGVEWRRYNYGVYSDIHEKIRGMKMNTAIKIELDNPNPKLRGSLYSKIRRMDPNFHIAFKQIDKEGKRWAIAKFPLVEDKKKK